MSGARLLASVPVETMRWRKNKHPEIFLSRLLSTVPSIGDLSKESSWRGTGYVREADLPDDDAESQAALSRTSVWSP